MPPSPSGHHGETSADLRAENTPSSTLAAFVLHPCVCLRSYTRAFALEASAELWPILLAGGSLRFPPVSILSSRVPFAHNMRVFVRLGTGNALVLTKVRVVYKEHPGGNQSSS